MKEVYIVKLTNGKDFMEFNFNKVTQASEFIHLALLHGNTITATIKHYHITEEGEGQNG